MGGQAPLWQHPDLCVQPGQQLRCPEVPARPAVVAASTRCSLRSSAPALCGERQGRLVPGVAFERSPDTGKATCEECAHGHDPARPPQRLAVVPRQAPLDTRLASCSGSLFHHLPWTQCLCPSDLSGYVVFFRSDLKPVTLRSAGTTSLWAPTWWDAPAQVHRAPCLSPAWPTRAVLHHQRHFTPKFHFMRSFQGLLCAQRLIIYKIIYDFPFVFVLLCVLFVLFLFFVFQIMPE